MQGQDWIQVAITIIGWVAVVATMRSELAGLGKRVAKLEDKHDLMPTAYVPRIELQGQLNAIQATAVETKALVHLAVFGKRPSRAEEPN